MYRENSGTGTSFGIVAGLVVFHRVEEDIKQADQVGGTSFVLRVELDAGKTRGKEFEYTLYPHAMCPF